MRLLLPTDVPFTTDPLSDEVLPEVYRRPQGAAPDDTWLRANFVSTLDGAATGPDGRSGSINTEADRAVFALLRALADVIVVGAGTARTERYRPPVVSSRWQSARERLGRSPQPAMLVVTGSGDLPPLLAEQRADAGDVLLATCTSAPTEAVDRARTSLGEDRVILAGDERVDFACLLARLAERGLRDVLCEGGPHLMRELVAQGVLDELCLTLTPTLLGGDHLRIVAGADVDAPLSLHTLIEADGSLIGRWIRASE